MLPKSIYLDNQSTTPIDPRVLDSMLPYLTTHFGNASSRTHQYGFKTEEAIINAKKQVSKLINCKWDELIIVNGATEANNLALKGLAEFKKIEIDSMKQIQKNNVKKEGIGNDEINVKDEKIKDNKSNIGESNTKSNINNQNSNNIHSNCVVDDRPHLITVQTEHKAVLDTLRNLPQDFRITYLPVKKSGHIDLDTLKSKISPNTICISVMGINNETGTIQDLKRIGDLCKHNNIVFHVDGAQMVGKIPIDVNDMNIGMLSISAHKMYGPKGVGMLYVRKKPRIRIKAQNYGGGQERNIRSGTLPTELIVGLGKAAEIAMNEMERDYKHVKTMSQMLYNKLKKKIKGIVQNGGKRLENTHGNEEEQSQKNDNDTKEEQNDDKSSTKEQNDDESNFKEQIDTYKEMKSLDWYPGCLNISFPYVEGEGLLMRLKNIALSSGSACTSASLEPSYVLRALGQDEDLAHSSIRFGIGRFTTKKEIKEVSRQTVKAVKKLLEMSPLYEMVNEGVDLKSIKWSGE